MGKVIKYIFYTVIFLVCGLIFFRSCVMLDYYPKEMKSILWNEELAAKYNEAPKDFKAFTQDIRFSYDNAKEGNFFSSNFVYLESAETLQITVRYNDSTLERFSEKYGIDEEDIKFAFSLSDDLGNHYKCSDILEDRAFGLYNYRRLSFEGVKLEGVKEIFLDVYFADDEDFEKSPLTAMVIYEEVLPLENYRIARSERP